MSVVALAGDGALAVLVRRIASDSWFAAVGVALGHSGPSRVLAAIEATRAAGS